MERILFLEWLSRQNYRKKIFIAGNHDNSLVGMNIRTVENGQTHYLCDSGTEFEGLKIFGSPWSKTFPGMNPACKAFTCDTEDELEAKWAIIPDDIDVLITHSPPFTILDKTINGRQVGSMSLLLRSLEGLKPKLWVFGHIHEAYGQDGNYNWNKTIYVNASHVNERYNPVNDPVRIIL